MTTSQLAHTKTVDVVAIEYPPFTSAKTQSNGLAFELLNNVEHENVIQWRPLFVPPKRAAKLIAANEWCASFYPVRDQKEQFRQYKLSESIVKLGLLRLRGTSLFQWQDLNELRGKSVALLRTNEGSPFIHQFKSAGLSIVFVEKVHTALEMVLLERVDLAFADSELIARVQLPENEKNKLQFSKTVLLETPISIFINPSCGVKLPEALLINQR